MIEKNIKVRFCTRTDGKPKIICTDLILHLVAVALLLFISVDQCHQLRTRRPSRAAQGHRPYILSLYALQQCILISDFRTVPYRSPPSERPLQIAMVEMKTP